MPIFELFSNNTRPYGITFEQWCIKWWSWLLEIPINKSPASDGSGYNANINQHDANVFFLCQTFEEQGPRPSRKISIQLGKSLFLPLINWISVAPEDGKTDDDLVIKANSKMNSVKDLTISVNGHEINNRFEEFRVQSHAFSVNLPQDNILKLEPGNKRVLSDGFWILTKPVTKSIDLSTFGSCTSGMTKISVNYEITVR